MIHMNIVWHGYSCFRITENLSGGEVAVVIDPFGPEDGAKLPRNLAADLVVSSHDHARHNNVSAIGGDPFVIDGPGEYEVREVMVTGVQTFLDDENGKKNGDNTLYYFVINGVHIVHVGDLKHKLDPKHLTHFHDIDVLMVPVGGNSVLDAKQAVDIVGQIQPRIVIPMHFKAGKTCQDCDGVDVFLKAMGSSPVEPVNKLKLSVKDLPQEDTKIVILDPQ